MTQSPMNYSNSSVGLNTLIPCAITSTAPVNLSPSSTRSNFLEHLLEAANQISHFDEEPSLCMFSEQSLDKNIATNYVVRRDVAGRPTVWRIGGMTRKISYLANGKIKSVEDTGKLPTLAGANGAKSYLLDWETYDYGRTYIGRLMVNEELDSLVMTDMYLRNDGTVVATDDSGFEMTWNPNNGDTSTEFRQHHHQREAWTDHIDGTVTIEMNCDNGTRIVMHGKCDPDFIATNVQIKANGGTFELQASGEKVCRTIVDPQGWSEVRIITRDLNQISTCLLRATGVGIRWKKGAGGEPPMAFVSGDSEDLLHCLNHDH